MSGWNSKARAQRVLVLLIGMAPSLAAGEVEQPKRPKPSVGEQAGKPAKPWFPPLSPESYADLESIWPKGTPIPVCWEELSSKHAQQRRWVEHEISTYLERVTPVAFSGDGGARLRWPRCAAESLGIRIAVKNVRPSSEVGMQRPLDEATKTYVPAPTRMTLNFTLDGPYKMTCARRQEFCVRLIALHEFMHAIGFLHEQLRSDTPPECKKKWDHHPDFRGFKPSARSDQFDPDSIMNYCNNIYEKTTAKLSKNDIEAVEDLYGYQ